DHRRAGSSSVRGKKRGERGNILFAMAEGSGRLAGPEREGRVRFNLFLRKERSSEHRGQKSTKKNFHVREIRTLIFLPVNRFVPGADKADRRFDPEIKAPTSNPSPKM